MDDAVRIPIDLGYEVAAAEADASSSLHRTTVREDGTLVIDILARPCEPSADGEIVVCAAPEGQVPVVPAPPLEPLLMDEISEALTAEVGPVELGPGTRPDGTVGFGARIRF